MRFAWLAKTVMLATVLLAPQLHLGGPSMAQGFPKRYLLPDWYSGKVAATVSGNQVTVKAQLQSNLATMKNARVRLEPGKGLTLTASSLSSSSSKSERKGATVSSQTAVSSHSSASSSGSLSSGQTFEGDLPPGGKLEVQGTLQAQPGLDHAFATLAFDYDFPTDEILAYIDQHKVDLYPDEGLREILIRAVKEQHTGRKSEGITERIELKGTAGK